jgi:hypothetical protein
MEFMMKADGIKGEWRFGVVEVDGETEGKEAR